MNILTTLIKRLSTKPLVDKFSFLANDLRNITEITYENVQPKLNKIIAALHEKLANENLELFRLDKELEKASRGNVQNRKIVLSKLQQQQAEQQRLLKQYEKSCNESIQTAKKIRLILYKQEKKYTKNDLDSLLTTLDDTASLPISKKNKKYIEKLKDALVTGYKDKSKSQNIFESLKKNASPSKLSPLQKKIWKEVTCYVEYSLGDKEAPDDYIRFCNRKIKDLDSSIQALKKYAENNLKNSNPKKYEKFKKLLSEFLCATMKAQSKVNGSKNKQNAFKAMVNYQEECATAIMKLNALEIFAEHKHNRVLMGIGKVLFAAISALMITAPYWLDRAIFKAKTGYWEPISLKDKPISFYKLKAIKDKTVPLVSLKNHRNT